jgi:uncharacterized protein (TIGR02145 family)
MPTEYHCKNNSTHVFQELSEDLWCPECPRELRSELVVVEVPKPDPIVDPNEEQETNKTPEPEAPLITEEVTSEEVTSEEVTSENPTDGLGAALSATAEHTAEPTTTIGNQVWRNAYLNITEIEGLVLAEKPEEWKAAHELKTPAYCYPNEDIKLQDTLGCLYNWYALALLEKHLPEGFRIPDLNDIKELALNSADNFLAQEAPGIRSNPIAHRLPLSTYADGTKDRCFWTNQANGHYTAHAFRVSVDKHEIQCRQIDKNAGYFVRLLKTK